MFNDPNALATAVPGMQKLEKIDDNPLRRRASIYGLDRSLQHLQVSLSVTDENPPESCTLNVEGKGAAGFAKGVGKVHFTDLGDNTTLLKYSGDVNIGGTLASVGQRMIDSVAKSMIQDLGLEKLEKTLEERWQQK